MKIYGVVSLVLVCAATAVALAVAVPRTAASLVPGAAAAPRPPAGRYECYTFVGRFYTYMGWFELRGNGTFRASTGSSGSWSFIPGRSEKSYGTVYGAVRWKGGRGPVAGILPTAPFYLRKRDRKPVIAIFFKTAASVVWDCPLKK